MNKLFQALFISGNMILGVLFPIPYVTIYLGFSLGFLTYAFLEGGKA